MGTSGLAIAALAGAWGSHLAEYLRVLGRAQLSVALTKAPHTYLGPIGIVLAVLGVVGVRASVRFARRLERRVSRLRAVLLGAPPPSDVEGTGSTRVLSFPTLLAVFWTLQLALYLVQENLEARTFHLPAPGLGAVTGVHAMAPLVHLAVAAIVTTVVWLTRRRVTELLAESDWTDGVIARRGPRPTRIAGRRLIRSWTPGQRWGMALWARPPPLGA